MPHSHRPPREEPASPLVPEPGHLPVEPDDGAPPDTLPADPADPVGDTLPAVSP
jgi:hypothetical protein